MINPDPKMIAHLNLLSDLIGKSIGVDSSRSGLIKLSLFGDDDDDDGPLLVICFLNISLGTTLFIRVPTRTQAPPLMNQHPKNEDITIDISKVSCAY